MGLLSSRVGSIAAAGLQGLFAVLREGASTGTTLSLGASAGAGRRQGLEHPEGGGIRRACSLSGGVVRHRLDQQLAPVCTGPGSVAGLSCTYSSPEVLARGCAVRCVFVTVDVVSIQRLA